VKENIETVAGNEKLEIRGKEGQGQVLGFQTPENLMLREWEQFQP